MHARKYGYGYTLGTVQYTANKLNINASTSNSTRPLIICCFCIFLNSSAIGPRLPALNYRYKDEQLNANEAAKFGEYELQDIIEIPAQGAEREVDKRPSDENVPLRLKWVLAAHKGKLHS